MEVFYSARNDGGVLLQRCWRARAGAPVVFVGHSQPTHSGHLVDLCTAMARRGWAAHSGDLRGHGGSLGGQQKLAHLDLATGWDDLIADARQMIALAFSNVPWEDRLLIAPNIMALLVLELLKNEPRLARNIVLISPPPNQRVLYGFAQAFIKARLLFCAADKPDEHTLHHLYTFLGAHLNQQVNLFDVISDDSARLERMKGEDQTFFPTPTPAYWNGIFKGMSSAWSWPKSRTIDGGTRIQLMYGGEDPMMGNGAFVGPIVRWFAEKGVEDVNACKVEGARTGVFLEESRLGIAERILQWVGNTSTPDTIAQTNLGLSQVSSVVLERIGRAIGAEDMAADALIDLCYRAIEDDACWTEILYRLTLNMSADEKLDSLTAERLIEALMPHWDRAYRIKRHVNREAAVGAMLQAVVDRLDIGMAVVGRDLQILNHNRTFSEALTAIGVTPTRFRSDMPQDFLEQIRQGAREALLLVDGRPLGYFFRPPNLRAGDSGAASPCGIIVLRQDGAGRSDALNSQICLLEMAYGLTRQEAAIALEITRGRSPENIADQLGLSIHTIRTHLKRGYDKIGVTGQTDLIARLMHGPIGWLGGENRVG